MACDVSYASYRYGHPRETLKIAPHEEQHTHMRQAGRREYVITTSSTGGALKAPFRSSNLLQSWSN